MRKILILMLRFFNKTLSFSVSPMMFVCTVLPEPICGRRGHGKEESEKLMEENTEPGAEVVEEVNKSAGDVTEMSVVKEEKSETQVRVTTLQMTTLKTLDTHTSMSMFLAILTNCKAVEKALRKKKVHISTSKIKTFT